MRLKKILDTILQPRTLMLLHPDSPGDKVLVKRTIIGRFFKSSNFATGYETSLSYRRPDTIDHEQILMKILDEKEILPILIGIDKNLDNLIREKLK